MTFVYIIESADGFTKIGISGDPQSRLSSLQTGNHRSLSIARSFDLSSIERFSAADVEHLAHKYMARFRVSGEWFLVPRSYASYCVDRAFFELAKADTLRRWRGRFALPADAVPKRIWWFALMEGRYTDDEMRALLEPGTRPIGWEGGPNHSVAVECDR